MESTREFGDFIAYRRTTRNDDSVGERARGEVDRKITKVERATGSDKLEHPIDGMLREAVACNCAFGTSMKEKLRKKWNSLETKLVSSLM